MHKYFFNFFRDNNVITAFQSGFVPGDSTVNQLIDTYNTFCKALDEGKEVRAILCDISKAFDRVWHKGLLFKLKSAGVSGPLRQHLHSKNIVDNPYCTCGDVEDTHHFLFVCHQYTDLRRDLLNSVSDICQPNLNFLLCGDMTLTYVQNKQIFKAVQEFIIKSKRFEYTH